MTEVIVDGIKYVPSDDVKTQIKTMEKVLKSMEYLSEKAIEEIISKFEEFSNEDEKPQKSITSKVNYWENKIYQFDITAKKGYNIKWVYPNGTVQLKSGVKAGWKIQDAIEINVKYHEGLTYSEFKQIVNGVKHNRATVGRILYSLVYGDLKDWIEKWKRMNTPTLKHKQVPIQNNPEKRKELGYGGIP